MMKRAISLLLAAAIMTGICQSSMPVTAAELTPDEQLDAILAEIITDDMTDYQKLETVTKYTAENFSYTEEHLANQLWEDLIEYGGGDCWANTDMIAEMCRRLGIPHICHDSAYIDYGASGHMNVVALADGKYYIADAGMYGEKPRDWMITELGALPFKTGNTDSGVMLRRYYGFEHDIVIPEEIDGKPVTSIGIYAFSTRQLTTAGRLPYGYVSDWEFSYVSTVQIPDTVTEIQPAAFECALIGTVTLPLELESIAEYTFYGCRNLSTVVIPAGVTEIGEEAFAQCSSLTDVYYTGTAESWQALRIAEGNEPLLSAALHFGMPPEAGDVNLDGVFDLADAAALQQWLTAAPDAALACWENADFFADGLLDARDLTCMKRTLLGASA